MPDLIVEAFAAANGCQSPLVLDTSTATTPLVAGWVGCPRGPLRAVGGSRSDRPTKLMFIRVH